MKVSLRTRGGFSIVEIMTVVCIMGVLAGIAVPLVVRARDGVKIKQAQSDLDQIAAAVQELAWDTGKWPMGRSRREGFFDGAGGVNECGDLRATNAGIVFRSDAFDGDKWKGPYIDNLGLLVDPWGRPYMFDSDYTVNDGTSSSRVAVVVHSGGPNKSGLNAYDKDNIVKEIKR